MFKWKDDFSVNIEKINEQHKELFKMGTELYNLVSAKDGVDRYDEIMTVIHRLAEYTIEHFTYEEELMKIHGYKDFDNHKKQHDAFVAKIQSIKADDVDVKQRKIGMDLIVFIANWIENHILVTDMKYKNYLNSKGVY
ncbi:bacteriohemerythrin [Tissierella sp. P1]|jgi:hemerythrin|uniref:bacteriohemerythrin n=1 Tax=Tissierella TaxID=41273 RepID=UPI000BA0FA6B|nr:bacteriohemerythrin [Tissierella sp. P1]MDU5082528.1 bacteriohemerythrin [Bacillota bacterium]OZV11127.1 bacteriohemerythrin [Tissierella sp. P1]